LKHFWCTNKPWGNMDSENSPRPRFGGSHHLLPYSIIYAWSWGQHPNVILSQDSQVGILKFSKLGLSWFWRPITLCADLRLRWGLKQSCSSCWELSNGMWHATYTQGNQGDSWLLIVGSQIDNLIFNLFFGHNLCFKYSNGWCGSILDIYVLRFGSPLGLQLPKWELIWECGASFPHTFLHSWEHEMWFPCSL